MELKEMLDELNLDIRLKKDEEFCKYILTYFYHSYEGVDRFMSRARIKKPSTIIKWLLTGSKQIDCPNRTKIKQLAVDKPIIADSLGIDNAFCGRMPCGRPCKIRCLYLIVKKEEYKIDL